MQAFPQLFEIQETAITCLPTSSRALLFDFSRADVNTDNPNTNDNNKIKNISANLVINFHIYKLAKIVKQTAPQ